MNSSNESSIDNFLFSRTFHDNHFLYIRSTASTPVYRKISPLFLFRMSFCYHYEESIDIPTGSRYPLNPNSDSRVVDCIKNFLISVKNAYPSLRWSFNSWRDIVTWSVACNENCWFLNPNWLPAKAFICQKILVFFLVVSPEFFFALNRVICL